MKALKVIALIIGILSILIVVVSFFLPKTYSVNRTTLVKAPDSVIYKNIADFNEFAQWNPWSKMEPSAKITISGPIAQPQHLYQWIGDKTGSGQMKITAVVPNKMVDMELKFIKPFESLANINFQIQQQGEGGILVVWTMYGENKGIMDKWMSLMMDKMIGKDFEDGLRFLKEKSEKK